MIKDVILKERSAEVPKPILRGSVRLHAREKNVVETS